MAFAPAALAARAGGFPAVAVAGTRGFVSAQADSPVVTRGSRAAGFGSRSSGSLAAEIPAAHKPGAADAASASHCCFRRHAVDRMSGSLPGSVADARYSVADARSD